jgi:glycerol-3-phosphate acyltransferase PlsY
MSVILNILVLAILAYLIGSIPFAIIVARLKGGVDIRSVGSRHAGATNVMRAAGWGAAILVLILDLAKGYLMMWLALNWGQTPWSWAVVAAIGVVGHCWPLFAGFRGGMGMAVAGGMLFKLWPLGFAIGLGVVAANQLIIRHSARANFATGLLLGPVWLLFAWIALKVNPAGYTPAGIIGPDWANLIASVPLAAAAAAAGVVIAVRSLSDWKRVYKELWLDRDG